MALGWISAFKAIPWSDLIAATPVITQGAKKLWGQVSKTKSSDKKNSQGINKTSSISSIDQRFSEMTLQIEELEEDQKLSSQLISELAEQNKQMIGAINVLNQRQKWLIATTLSLILTVLFLANLQLHLI